MAEQFAAGPPRGAPGGGNPAERIMALDQDDDGKISKDEAPEWMREQMFERVDTNGDGAIDREEAEVMAQRMREAGGPGERPRRPRRPDQE